NGSKVEQFLASLAHANIEREEVIAYVKSLLKQEFLISNLRISQSVPNTLQALKEILLDMGECAEQYIPIIDELLNLEAGIDYSNFEGLEQQLEAIEKANEYFQYDSYYLTPLQFPNHLKQELSQYAQVLYKISQLIEDNHQNMHYYLQRFV